MKFSDVVDQARTLLQRTGKITYRALKREFDLDDEALADLKDELLFSDLRVKEESGRGLVWVGAALLSSSHSQVPSSLQPLTPNPQPPASYTPPHLAERIRAAEITDGERKTITALFADLKGSTALIEGLDPEEARAIIDPALQVMMEAVHQYDGYVAQALGDGIFALFGAPIAQEDHPQRAVYAALRMQETMRRYGDQTRLKHGVPLAMRVGINTGEVVVRSIRKDDLHADYVPIGHSTNLAARMEQLATPGSILVTAHTQKLTDGYFSFKALGQTQIKGLEEPLHLYEVLGVGPARTRLQVSATRRGLTRFVGRQNELAQLQHALVQATAGQGQIVGVMGEPGLGKSRLFYEFKLLSHSSGLILETSSVSHGKASPYLPVIELLKNYFRLEPHDDERSRREKVTGKVLNLDRGLEDTLPYLFALLSIEEYPLPLQQMDSQIRRRRTFEALKKLFLRESLNRPLILIFEDLHWIDNETQGFLDTLSEGLASVKVLLLVNYRPEYRHEWGQKTYYSRLRLAPFGRVEAEEFLNELLGESPSETGRSPLYDLKQLILEKAEGAPFFMEEIVQEFVEQGVLVRDAVGTGFKPAATIPSRLDLHLPSTVQAILAARIDRLTPEEKALLQQLSVIGRQFPLGLVRQVIAQSEEALYRLLSSLQHKEFLYEQPAFPEVEYIFKHALTQEVAYNSVLIDQRKALHEQSGQAIEQLYQERLEEHYDELAHHYQRSGNTEKAVTYLGLAGRQAVQRSAYVEAVNDLIVALEFLETLPDTPKRDRQELALQLSLGEALIATKGYAAPEVGQTYMRARELCQQTEDTTQLFPVLGGLCQFRIVRAEYQRACDLGELILSLAQNTRDPAFLVEAHDLLGQTFFCMGELSRAQVHLEQSIRLYDPQHHRTLTLLCGGEDPGVASRDFAALALWLRGYPDQALHMSQAGLSLAQEIAHPFSLAHSCTYAAEVHLFRRNTLAVQKQAAAAITLSSEHGFTYHLMHGTILRGWALVEQGQEEEAVAMMRQGLETWQATRTEVARPWVLSLLAYAYGKRGQQEEGLTILAEALALIDKTGERVYEAELHRIKGELTLQLGTRDWGLGAGSSSSQVPNPKPQASTEIEREAEECFLTAIAIAQKQEAKSWELRAAMSLARLWQAQGKRAESHHMLSEIYNWFTEGFDTRDLQEAKALLELLHA